jgi:hypothetical protein
VGRAGIIEGRPMIVDILVMIFVAAFVALAVFGHVLLLGDIWHMIIPADAGYDGSTSEAMKVPAE